MRSVLLDSGPLIALFAVDDKHHHRFDDLVGELSDDGLRLLTTWPCIVEAAYLLKPLHRFEMLRWVELGGVVVYPLETYHLKIIRGWMQQYTEDGKREMDLADASLYWLATETKTTDIMTIDVANFSRYRLPDGATFTLL